MFSILFVVYLFVLSTVLALLEIQIEGNSGWAQRMPCWRPSEGSLIAKVYMKVMGGKPLTGYHLAFDALIILVLHYWYSAFGPLRFSRSVKR